MWGNISISKLNMASSANNSLWQAKNNIDELDSKRQADEKISKMKRLIRGEGDQGNSYGNNSILDSTLSYGESVRSSRTKSSDTALKLKQLRYNFKTISAELRRCKTSVSAKQAANKAKREVVKLKLKQGTGQYDSEELAAAINHAEAMERVAKKKLRHLLEEELVKIKDDNSESSKEGKPVGEVEEYIEAEEEKAYEEIDRIMEEMEENIKESVEEISSETLDELEDALQDMVEETFSQLADAMFTATDSEMTEDEFKEYVKKHRRSEDKDIVKADMEYLKALFEHYSKMLDDAKSGGAVMQPVIAGVSSSGISLSDIMPEMSISEGSVVDISV